jgi:molybdate transport system substrate-binding protein
MPMLRRLLAALFALCTAQAQATDVNVAVAANFTAPMRQIAAAFARDTGHKAVLAFGSTGRFYAQVKNGAPFEVLLAADDETPAKLAGEGFAVPASRFTYATGRLVLWSAQAGFVDSRGEVLRRGGFGKLALADPKLAPYGRAAMETLASLHLKDAVAPKLVQAENIAQAYQFVATGNAQLGFVALSQVTADGRIDKGSAWVVPASLHRPIRQDAVVLAAGRDNPAASALLQYLRSDAARAIIRAHGYEL